MTRRILVARLDSMGDVLVSGPAIRAIAAKAEVWLLCGPQGAAAAELLPGVRQVRVWTAPWATDSDRPVDETLTAELAAVVRECAPDEAVILTSFHQSPLPLALLLRLAGVPRITGASVDAAGGLLDTRLIPGEDFSEDLPEPERARTIAAAAGFVLPDEDDGGLAVRLSGAERPSTPDVPTPAPLTPALLTPALPTPYVVVHPGAAVPSRAWPPEQATAAVTALTAAGHRVVVTGGAGERALTARVAGTDALDLGGRLSLPQLAALIRDAAVLISGNTGPAHLAAAVRTPVVSLFAPVVPAARWAPYGVPVELLGDQHAACAGTRARVCPVPGHPCLASVTPDQVVAACERLLAGTRLPGAVLA
ncbi:glycosyltransferase family 9 protein [uncultured Amnibacterium sp.]|uniref:glycosyltransferase family 9 protein n=1 Tax=uncultured Amnibacterium sp. TaxID=1631851 RepID=UPI0035C9ABF8